MRSLPLLGVLAVSAGCAAPASFAGDELEGAGQAMRVDGVVTVERVRTTEGVQTSVGAKFLRHSASTESAERLVGSRLLLPARGECASVSSLEEADASAASRSSASGTWAESSAIGDVELIDVGDVAIAAPFAVRLSPRAFPDVGELVSGVFYTSPDVDAPLPAAARYTFEASGAASTDAFQLAADAPADLGEVQIGGIDLTTGDGAEAPRVRSGADVLVTWEVPARPTAEATRPQIYVDVQGSGGQVHRCTFEDDGSAILPGLLFAGPSVAIAVHRLQEVELAMPVEADAAQAEAPPTEAGRAIVRFDLASVGRVDVDEAGSSGAGSSGAGSSEAGVPAVAPSESGG